MNWKMYITPSHHTNNYRLGRGGGGGGKGWGHAHESKLRAVATSEDPSMLVAIGRGEKKLITGRRVQLCDGADERKTGTR
jgi:hypothetical protein